MRMRIDRCAVAAANSARWQYCVGCCIFNVASRHFNISESCFCSTSSLLASQQRRSHSVPISLQMPGHRSSCIKHRRPTPSIRPQTQQQSAVRLEAYLKPIRSLASPPARLVVSGELLQSRWGHGRQVNLLWVRAAAAAAARHRTPI